MVECKSATSVGREAPPPVCAETVLLVDDDGRVRDLAREILERRGYRVLPAGNACQARELAAVYAEPIHLLLTDVMMPDESGCALALGFVAERPDLRVLFTSGQTSEALESEGLTAWAMVLNKPFGVEQFARAVRETLDGPPPSPRDPGVRAGRSS